MKFSSRTITAALLLLAATTLASEPHYSIRIGSVSAAAGEPTEIEIRVDAAAADIAAIAFVIDYDESRLAIAEDSAKHPRIQVSLPPEFTSSVFLLSESTGKIGISLYDPVAPISTLSTSVMARLRFQVRSSAEGFARVALAVDESPSVAGRAGNRIEGSYTSVAGGIAITAQRVDLAVSPREISFGTVPSERSVEQAAVIVNAGNAPLPIASIALENGGRGFQLTSPATPLVVPAGGSVPVTIRFHSSESGQFSDRLLVSSSVVPPYGVEVSATTLPDGTFSYDTKKVIPAVASTIGGENTSWRSSLTLHNRLEIPVGVRVTFTKNDGTDIGPTELVIEPRETRSHVDVLGELFGQTGAIGSLRVEASSPDLIIRSSTYSVRPDGGTSAQSIPAVDWRDLFRGEPAYLTGLERSAAKRTNIGLLSLANETVMLRVTLLNSRGDAIGSRDYPLRPKELIASIDVFDALGLSTAVNLTAVIAPLTPNATFYAYASTVDNRTAAPLFQAPR